MLQKYAAKRHVEMEGTSTVLLYRPEPERRHQLMILMAELGKQGTRMHNTTHGVIKRAKLGNLV